MHRHPCRFLRRIDQKFARLERDKASQRWQIIKNESRFSLHRLWTSDASNLIYFVLSFNTNQGLHFITLWTPQIYYLQRKSQEALAWINLWPTIDADERFFSSIVKMFWKPKWIWICPTYLRTSAQVCEARLFQARLQQTGHFCQRNPPMTPPIRDQSAGNNFMLRSHQIHVVSTSSNTNFTHIHPHLLSSTLIYPPLPSFTLIYPHLPSSTLIYPYECRRM